MRRLGLLLALLPGVAAAEVGVGARIGGYGFREIHEGAPTWEGCRMDGFGLFATYDLDDDRQLFAEGAVDFYQATKETVEDERMDRLSLHGQAAFGVRIFPDAVVSPHLQAGVGAEWTKLEVVGMGMHREAVLATGFLGVGAEVKPMERLGLGANVRFLAMAGPDLDHHTRAPSDEDIPLAYRAAGQVQFFLRYVL